MIFDYFPIIDKRNIFLPKISIFSEKSGDHIIKWSYIYKKIVILLIYYIKGHLNI